MAQNSRSGSTHTGLDAPVDAIADAAQGALGLAAHVGAEAPVQACETLSALTALCDRAADHMALAHSLLVAHENNADTAAEHLDAALVCLRKVVADSAPRTAASQAAEARSA